MAILDTILQQLNIWDGQLLLFIQNHLRSETLNPIVIAVTNLGNAGIFWIVLSKENQTCGDFVPVGAAWFSVCDKFPVEKLCGACSPLRSRAGIAMPDPGTKRLVLPVRTCIRILRVSGGDL